MNNKKKILIFIDWFLPGYKAGGPIRSCANLVDHLADQFDFYIVTRNTDYLDDTPYQNITPNKWILLPNQKAQVLYLSDDVISFKKIKNIINEQSWDVIYINGLFSFYFSLAPLLYSKNIKTIVAVRGMLAESALKIKWLKKKVFLNLVGKLGFYKHVTFHATNQKEQDDINKQLGYRHNIVVVPNLHKVSRNTIPHNIEKKTGELKLINLARIAPEKNLLFGLKLLKDGKYEGNIILDIYGAIYDKAYWEQCTAIIQKLPENIKVTYNGMLHAGEVEKKIAEYHFLFLPTRGENFGHVVLESFISGRPVIISDQTPWKELKSYNVGWDIELKEEKFKEVISEALNLSNDEYDKKVQACNTYTFKVINDKSILEQNIQLFS